MPDIVIVPTRGVASVLAVKVAVMVPLPLPLAGFTVNHPASSSIVQLVLERILKVVLPAAGPTV